MESYKMMNGIPNGNHLMNGNGSQNGNCPTGRKKLEPVSNSVYILDLRKLMGSWKLAGITYAQMFKVERLYLGETGWMDIDGRYPYNNLYQIARGMKFDSVTALYKCIKRCEGFGIIYHDGIKDVEHFASFFSNLWHQPDSNEQVVYYSSVSGADNYNININNNKYNYQHLKQRTPETEESAATFQQTYTDFMFYLMSDEGAFELVVKKVDDACVRLMNKLAEMNTPIGKHSINPATKRFFDFYLRDHMLAKQHKFICNSNEGRKIWLTRLLPFPFMQENIAKAVNDIRQALSTNALDVIRQIRPLCQFEYQHPSSGQRLYDSFEALDAQGNILPDASKESVGKYIPKDAPPRPSAHAEWDNDYQQWVEE